MPKYRLGRKAAITDHRVARLSRVGSGLADPPPSANWYADVIDWGMLGNDQVGDCVVAFGMHYVYQQLRYLSQDKAAIPTTAEAIANYSAIGGYDPADPETDAGLAVMGPGGLIEYWTRTGLLCGGEIHKLTNVVQITRPNPKEWRQAISLFGGMGVGVRLPESIMEADDVPFLWSDPSGPIAGYHEMFLVGYETMNGHTYYDCITWGTRVRLTEAWLQSQFDEGVAVLSMDGMDAGGINAAGLSKTDLAARMALLQEQG